jgi:hypothetical protein
MVVHDRRRQQRPVQCESRQAAVFAGSRDGSDGTRTLDLRRDRPLRGSPRGRRRTRDRSVHTAFPAPAGAIPACQPDRRRLVGSRSSWGRVGFGSSGAAGLLRWAAWVGALGDPSGCALLLNDHIVGSAGHDVFEGGVVVSFGEEELARVCACLLVDRGRDGYTSCAGCVGALTDERSCLFGGTIFLADGLKLFVDLAEQGLVSTGAFLPDTHQGEVTGQSVLGDIRLVVSGRAR